MVDDEGLLRVTRSCAIPLSELEWRFSASGGPGGQHANRSNTRAEVRFDVAASPSLLEVHRERLVQRLGPVVRVVVDDERSQLRNRSIARERLAGRLRNALTPTKVRRPTRATRGSQVRRLESKRRRGETKQTRRRPGHDG